MSEGSAWTRAVAPSSPCNTTGAGFKAVGLETGAPASVVISDKFGREIKAATIGFDGTAVITETRYNDKGQVDEVEKPYLHKVKIVRAPAVVRFPTYVQTELRMR